MRFEKRSTENPAADLWRFASVTDLTSERFLHSPIFYPCVGDPLPLIKLQADAVPSIPVYSSRSCDHDPNNTQHTKHTQRRRGQLTSAQAEGEAERPQPRSFAGLPGRGPGLLWGTVPERSGWQAASICELANLGTQQARGRERM